MQDPLGSGLWRRLHDDCATATRQSNELAALLPTMQALAATAQTRWPSVCLDVPSDADGRAVYERLSRVQRAFREVAYRARLASSGAPAVDQHRLRLSALEEAGRLLAELQAELQAEVASPSSKAPRTPGGEH